MTILDTFFNEIHAAMNGDFVGRNSSGVPASGQNLGTAAIPWGSIRTNALVIGGTAVDASQITSNQRGLERQDSNDFKSTGVHNSKRVCTEFSNSWR